MLKKTYLGQMVTLDEKCFKVVKIEKSSIDKTPPMVTISTPSGSIIPTINITRLNKGSKENKKKLKKAEEYHQKSNMNTKLYRGLLNEKQINLT
jgi:hypothetical protein